MREGAGTSRGSPLERSQQLAGWYSDQWSEEGRQKRPPFPGLEFVLEKEDHCHWDHWHTSLRRWQRCRLKLRGLCRLVVILPLCLRD